MSAPSTEGPWDRFVRELRQSPGRSALLAAGLVVALLVWVPRLRSAQQVGSKAPQAQPAAGAVSGQSPAAIRADFGAIAERARELRRLVEPIDARIRRDPFGLEEESAGDAPAAPVRQSAPAPRFVLTAVVRFPSGPRAVVSGRVVREGDTIEGWRVTRIEERSALLQGPSGTMRLELGEESGRKEGGP